MRLKKRIFEIYCTYIYGPKKWIMLEIEFQYYLDNQDKLVEKYDGKVLVIVGKDVVGVYDDESTAYFKSIKKYKIGTFLIQKCTAGTQSYTQTFHSRVIFA